MGPLPLWGYDEPGQITENQKKAYSVIVFDELSRRIRCAQYPLQILVDGHITDATARKVNFKIGDRDGSSNWGPSTPSLRRIQQPAQAANKEK